MLFQNTFSSVVPDVAVDDLVGVEGFEGVAHGYAHLGHLGVGFSAPTFLNDLRGPRMPSHLGEHAVVEDGDDASRVGLLVCFERERERSLLTTYWSEST